MIAAPVSVVTITNDIAHNGEITQRNPTAATERSAKPPTAG